MNQYFIGIMLAPSASSESGVAVIDRKNEIIFLDKLFSMQDVQFFFENFSSLKDSVVSISLPWDNSMLNGKWRILSKPYQMVTSNQNFQNTDNWTQRFSNRGSDYFNKLAEEGVDISRFELFLTRQALKLESSFKERSPADCKSLQNALRAAYGFNLPTNMMPMAHLEAIVGAVLAKQLSDKVEAGQKIEKPIFEFNNLPVIRG